MKASASQPELPAVSLWPDRKALMSSGLTSATLRSSLLPAYAEATANSALMPVLEPLAEVIA